MRFVPGIQTDAMSLYLAGIRFGAAVDPALQVYPSAVPREEGHQVSQLLNEEEESSAFGVQALRRYSGDC